MVDNDFGVEPECGHEEFGSWKDMDSQANEGDPIPLDKLTCPGDETIPRTTCKIAKESSMS